MAITILEERVKIAGTLHFNGHDYALLAPYPFPIRDVSWKIEGIALFYVINPEGFGTYLYIHGNFAVDFARAGEIRTVKYAIDNEKGEPSEEIIDRRIKTLVETVKI